MEADDEMSDGDDIPTLDLETASDVSVTLYASSNLKYTIREAYDMNKKAQQCLEECIAHLRQRIEINLVEQDRLRSKSSDNKVKLYKIKPYRLFFPYFHDSIGLHPPPNEDTIEKKRHNYVDAYLRPPDFWYETEVTAFFSAIKKNVRVMAMKPMTMKVEYLREKKKKKYLKHTDVKKILAEITSLNEKIETIRSKPFKKLWNEGDITLDWLMISCDMQKRGFDRSPESCELMWTNYLRPGINRQKFTHEEDQRLYKIGNLYQQRNWDNIAEYLGTNRTPVQCLERFQSTLNKKFFNKYWSPDEDQKLTEVIEFCRIGNFIPWKKVIQYMNGRSLAQIYFRWDRCGKPRYRNGPWMEQEDAIVSLAIELIGKHWMGIARLLNGRSSFACCDRYKSVLDPILIVNPWSWEEDKLLLTFVAVYGEKWNKISNNFTGKSEDMVNTRCKVLKQSKPELYEQILKSSGRNLNTLLPHEQFAKSLINENANDKRKQIFMKAFNCAKDAVHQVCGQQFDISTCNTFRELALGIDMFALEEVSKLLLSPFYDESIKYKFPRYNHDYLMKLENEQELDMSFAISVAEEEVMTQEEIDALEREFDERIFSSSIIGYNQFANKQIFQDHRQETEYDSLYFHLRKVFITHENRDSDDEINFSDEGDLFEDVDLKNAISRVMNRSVLIETTTSEFPVIPINMSTINSLIIILLMRRLMSLWIAQLPSEVIDIVDTILDDEEELPKSCPNCESIKLNGINSSTVYCASEQNQSSICAKCKDMKCIKERIRLLLNRFLLTFALPTLLAVIKPSEDQIRIFLLKGVLFHNRFERYLVKREVLQVYTDDDDSSTVDDDDDLSDFTYS